MTTTMHNLRYLRDRSLDKVDNRPTNLNDASSQLSIRLPHFLSLYEYNCT